MSYLRYLCLFAYSGVQRILCSAVLSCATYVFPRTSRLSIFDRPVAFF